MAVTEEQVANLNVGDVVEIRDDKYPDAVLRGKVRKAEDGWLILGQFLYLASSSGELVKILNDCTLTVIERAPRPIYVNHPRTEPMQHDVIRDRKGTIRHYGGPERVTGWWAYEIEPGFGWTYIVDPPKPLTLLVDGETGQVVP